MGDDEMIRKVTHAMMAMQRRAWEQGVAAQAMLELGEMDWVVLLAKDAVVNQLKDGRLGLNEGNGPVADPAANGEPLLYAAEVTGDPALQEAADRMLEFLVDKAPRTTDGLIYHNYIENRIWVDACYMAPPFLAAAGRLADAVAQLMGYADRLYQPEAKLFRHIWDEDLHDYVRAQFWGVGNGWAAAGMARVIGMLGEDFGEERIALVGYLRELLDGCLAHQRSDGLFHNVLDDPNTFVETNAAQMLAYTIYRGVADGWLNRKDYVAHADRMRAAAHDRVDPYGLVQGVCGAPHFDRPGTATEGQAFFLLMEAAHRDLGG